MIDFKQTQDVLLLHVEVISICFHDETRAVPHPFHHSTIDTGFLEDQSSWKNKKPPEKWKQLHWRSFQGLQIEWIECLRYAQLPLPGWGWMQEVLTHMRSLSLGCFTLLSHKIYSKNKSWWFIVQAVTVIFLIKWCLHYTPQLAVLLPADPQWRRRSAEGG